MFLLYCDASGNSSFLDRNNRCYVMLGLCIHESAWVSLENSIKVLKRPFQIGNTQLELHAKDMFGKMREQSQVLNFTTLSFEQRRIEVLAKRAGILQGIQDREKRKERMKEYRQTDQYIHLSLAERRSLFEKALDLVGSHAGITLIAEIIEKADFRITLPGASPVSEAFEQMTTRYDAFISHKRIFRSGTENGILVMDDEPAHASDLRTLLDKYRSIGHHWGRLNKVIEMPFSVDSSIVGGVQLADLCAYATRRYLEKYTISLHRDETDFLRFYSRFARSRSKPWGIRHFCQKGTCQCKVCVDRKHNIP